MPLSAGTRLGPYEILSALGAGGTGEVFRTRQATVKREVALKISADAFTRDPNRLPRFEREAELLATFYQANSAPPSSAAGSVPSI
jgi:serine/threonine protein kinase